MCMCMCACVCNVYVCMCMHSSIRVDGFEASFTSQAWKMFDVVDAMRNAWHALGAPASPGLRTVIDGRALEEKRIRRARASEDGGGSGEGGSGEGGSRAGGGRAGGDGTGGGDTGGIGSDEESPPAAVAAWKHQGDAAIKTDPETAFGCYTAAMEHYHSAKPPSRAAAILASNRAAASMQMLCHAQAVVDAKRACWLDPQWPKAHARLGAAWMAQAHLARDGHARPERHASSATEEQAAAAYRRALALCTDGPSCNAWRHELSILEGVAVSGSMRDALVDPSQYDTKGCVAELKARGNAAFQAQRHCQALGLYAHAIHVATHANAAATPGELAILLSNRSASCLALGATSEALQDAKRCLSTDPSFVKGYLRLGRSLLQAGDWEAALDAFNEGLALAPADAALQAALADTVRQSGAG